MLGQSGTEAAGSGIFRTFMPCQSTESLEVEGVAPVTLHESGVPACPCLELLEKPSTEGTHQHHGVSLCELSPAL